MRPLTRSQSYLLLATIMSAGLVALHEAGSLHPLVTPLVAQDEARPLILRKGAEVVTIPAGDWVVAVDASGKEIIGRGKLMGVSGANLIIEGKYRHVIPLQHIGSLYHGHARAVGRSTLKGLGYGAIAGVAGGTAWWIRAAIPYSGFPDALIWYPLCVGFVSIFTIPSGAALGLLAGLVRHDQAVEYNLAAGEWEIFLE